MKVLWKQKEVSHKFLPLSMQRFARLFFFFFFARLLTESIPQEWLRTRGSLSLLKFIKTHHTHTQILQGNLQSAQYIIGGEPPFYHYNNKKFFFSDRIKYRLIEKSDKGKNIHRRSLYFSYQEFLNNYKLLTKP